MQPSPDSSSRSSTLSGLQLTEVSLLSAPGRGPVAVTQTSLWLPEPRTGRQNAQQPSKACSPLGEGRLSKWHVVF